MKLTSVVWWLLRDKSGMYLDAIGATQGVWSGTIRFSRRNAAEQFAETWSPRWKATPVKVRVYTVRRKKV